MFKFKDREQHEKDVCVQPCKYGCGKNIGPAPKRSLHESLQCPRRPVECSAGCGQRGLTFEYLEEHEKYICGELVQVSKPIPCTARLRH